LTLSQLIRMIGAAAASTEFRFCHQFSRDCDRLLACRERTQGVTVTSVVWVEAFMNVHVKGDLSVEVLAIVNRLKSLEGPLLPILHAVQEEFGYVPEQSLPLIASELNLSRAEVHGVVTFYHEFRSHPAGQHVVRICRAEACQSMGGRDIADHACKILDLDWHGTTPDGRVTLEPVYCLGLCSTAPSAQIDGELHGRLDTETLSALIKEVRQ
jgi:formate dehydrogenase subunit gamma